MIDRALRIATIALVLALGAIGLALPGSILLGGCAWLAFLVAVLAGWGTLGQLVLRERAEASLDLALRATWGLASFLAVAGVLLAAGVCSRGPLLGLAGLGLAGFAWHELTCARERTVWTTIHDGLRAARRNPLVAAATAIVVALVVVQVIAAVATLDRNPWDDDVAYTPLVKRLLDRGDLVEPFSFRRLASYGGQTVLQGLAGARGSLASVHLVDRGLGLGLFIALVVGYARERRTHPLWTALVVVAIVLAPHTYINTASYFTGAVGFFGLYRSVVRERWKLAGLVAGATCTLRMNYLPTAALFLVLALVFRLRARPAGTAWRTAWRRQWRTWVAVALAAAAVLLPYAIAALRSSGTPAYPLLGGTWNSAISLVPAVHTWTDELAMLLWCAVDTAPFVTIPILFLALVFVRDRRPARPLHALLGAASLAFLALVHAFLGSEVTQMWRYSFGPAAALVAAMTLELAGLDDDADGEVSLVAPGRWLIVAALIVQLATTRGRIPTAILESIASIGEARSGDATAEAERRRYAAMQAAIPAGSRVAVMVDDAAFLDFARDDLANLDTPGYASPDPGLPTFQGGAAWAAYLRAQGFDLVAFVRSERSRYFYRRPFWVQRIFTDSELFATMSAYTIDAIDALEELARTLPTRYDADGLVVVDLRGVAPTASPGRAGEVARREAYIRALAEREHLHAAWSLATRDDLRLEDGFATLAYVDAATGEPMTGARAAAGVPVRGMQRRNHVRIRGAGARTLALHGRVALDRQLARSRLDVALDGRLLTSIVVDADGRFTAEIPIDAAALAGGWHDLYLVWSAVSGPDRDVRDLYVARLEGLEWR